VNLELRVGVTISGKQGIRDGTAGYSLLDTRYLAGLAKINRLWGFCLSDLRGKEEKMGSTPLTVPSAIKGEKL